MEDFFDDIYLVKVLAIAFIAVLLNGSFQKEDFPLNKKEKGHLNKIGSKIDNRITGKTAMATFYLTTTIISLCIALLFLKKK